MLNYDLAVRRAAGDNRPPRQVIEAYLASKQLASTADLVQATGLSRSTIGKHLKGLFRFDGG